MGYLNDGMNRLREWWGRKTAAEESGDANALEELMKEKESWNGERNLHG